MSVETRGLEIHVLSITVWVETRGLEIHVLSITT